MNRMAAMTQRFPAVAQVREQVLARWVGLSDRERRAVILAAAVVALALGWMILVSPALRTLRTAQTQLADMDRQLATMQAQAAQARTLRSAPPVSPEEAASALRAATERLGRDARITIQGDRATLQFSNLQGTALAAWLAETRTGARARAVEASLTRAGATYSGSLVVALQPR